MSRLFGRLLACAGVCLVAGVYGCDAGHGFVKDDFAWILASRDWSGLFGAATGFFRPVVSLSFAANDALFGRAPLGYGLTNLALLFACLGTLVLLFRALGVSSGVAAAAAFVWALNFQGINMAVLWISGRTALLVTLSGAAAAWAFARGRRAASAALAMLAMGSKEEAFVLPAVLTAWSIIDARSQGVGGDRARRVIRETWLLWAALAASLALRLQSGAYTPASAPPFYLYQLDLMTFAANASGYADRAGTTPLLALLVFWLAAGLPRAARNADSSRLMLKGAVWVVLGFAPTILLPVRSSLYAVMPSVGAVLILAALAERMAERLTSRALTRATVVLALSFGALVPAYRLRNARYVKEAELSAAIGTELSRIAASFPAGGLVVIRDVRTGRPTAEQAFGALADRAALLMTDGKLRIWIDPPPAELAGTAPPTDVGAAIATLVVERGLVSVVREIRSR